MIIDNCLKAFDARSRREHTHGRTLQLMPSAHKNNIEEDPNWGTFLFTTNGSILTLAHFANKPSSSYISQNQRPNRRQR
jgi:hypothetical protein